MAGCIGTANVDVSHQAHTKEQAMPKAILLSIVTAMLLSGCATTGGRMATSEQRAACVEMEKNMGLGSPHDHGEMKGRGLNSMNLSHDRCMQILKQPG